MSEITYTLEITGIQKRTETGAVDKILWSKIGTNTDGVSASYNAVTIYSDIDTEGEEYIAFDDLTEEVVKGWIESDSQYQNCDPVIESRITEASIQRTLLGANEFPWNIPGPGPILVDEEADPNGMLPSPTPTPTNDVTGIGGVY